jgi:UDP-N-acetylglucosamine diphosphorylase/glucosamine-1-phosphate N-acetyltransferase
MRICVFEDAACSDLEPLTLTRPAFDLRCGAETLLERQVRHFAAREVAAEVRPELTGLLRQTRPWLRVNDSEGFGRGAEVLVNARWLPPAVPTPLAGAEVGLVGDQVAYVVPPAAGGPASGDDLARRLDAWAQALPRRDAGGRMINYLWDLIEHNGEALQDDLAFWRSRRTGASLPAGVSVAGPAENVFVDPTAAVEPLVLIDATAGPVLVDRGAAVRAFSRLQGPCYVGSGAHVLGAALRGSSVGPHCRVGGEVEATVFQGHANKAHDGFLGHSYVGEWVNLGAGTQASDLRNDYESVRFRLHGRTIDSGLLKVGAFLGDHAQTSVGALLNTGSAVGPFAQLLADGGLLPRAVPAFCRYGRGRLQERADLREMFATAAVMMGRRGRAWTEAHADFYLGLFERTADGRRLALREAEHKRLRRAV